MLRENIGLSMLDESSCICGQPAKTNNRNMQQPSCSHCHQPVSARA